MISVVVFDKGAEEWHCDTWLMSCRVLGRRVEEAVLAEAAAAARADGARRLVGDYLPTPKNVLVEKHYEKLGFRLIESLELPEGTVTLLRVNQEEDDALVHLPSDTHWRWNQLSLTGEPAHVILQTAKSINADLIVMTTDGPDGFLDGLRGSTSERVLNGANCPVGTLPVNSLFG